MSSRWWSAAIVLSLLIAVLTLLNPETNNWPFDMPVWLRAALNGAAVMIWVWIVEAVISLVRRVVTGAPS